MFLDFPFQKNNSLGKLFALDKAKGQEKEFLQQVKSNTFRRCYAPMTGFRDWGGGGGGICLILLFGLLPDCKLSHVEERDRRVIGESLPV